MRKTPPNNGNVGEAAAGRACHGPGMRPLSYRRLLRIVAGPKTPGTCQRRSRTFDPRRLIIAILALVLSSIVFPVRFAAAAEGSDPMAQIKDYLVYKLERMDAAAHDYVANANAYQAIIDKFAGDYDRAAIEQGPALLQIITKMQDDYRVYHNHGYETIEGITAGTKVMVSFDTYLDAGVAKSEASTDSPDSPMILKSRDGRMISDRNGNLFHYVIEPTLWGTNRILSKS
jgi:hypothetical protein